MTALAELVRPRLEKSPRYTESRFGALAARATVALVLAGGRGSRLKQLTDWRAKPSVAFGGKFRIIDFTLSNCLNSGIRRIDICTQYKAHSLLRHAHRPPPAKPRGALRAARPARPGAREHGRARLRRGVPLPATSHRRRARGLGPRLRQGHHPRAGEGGRSDLRARLRPQLREHDQRRAVLARRGHHRRLLGSEHGSHPRPSRAEFVRQELADLDL